MAALNIEDLIGEVFGRLTIINEADRHVEPNGKAQRVMLCSCSCGGESKKQLKDLRKGVAKSCGCLHKEQPIDIKKEDRYGILTILNEANKYISPQGVELRRVQCRCDCGNKKEYILNSLRSGKATDCGCVVKIREKKITIDLLNIEKFNDSNTSDWKILKELSADRDEKGTVKRIVMAKCSCGVEKEMSLNNIKKSKSCSKCASILLSEKRKSLKTDEERAIDKSITSRYRGIKSRCNNINSKDYKNYGARGIKMCEEWRNSKSSFSEWCKNNGFELHLEIDREDNNGDYTPENCRFITKMENNRNQNRTVLDWEKVNKIRSEEYSQYSHRELAKIFNCSDWNIESVRHFKSWVK